MLLKRINHKTTFWKIAVKC